MEESLKSRITPALIIAAIKNHVDQIGSFPGQLGPILRGRSMQEVFDDMANFAAELHQFDPTLLPASLSQLDTLVVNEKSFSDI